MDLADLIDTHTVVYSFVPSDFSAAAYIMESDSDPFPATSSDPHVNVCIMFRITGDVGSLNVPLLAYYFYFNNDVDDGLGGDDDAAVFNIKATAQTASSISFSLNYHMYGSSDQTQSGTLLKDQDYVFALYTKRDTVSPYDMKVMAIVYKVDSSTGTYGAGNYDPAQDLNYVNFDGSDWSLDYTALRVNEFCGQVVEPIASFYPSGMLTDRMVPLRFASGVSRSFVYTYYDVGRYYLLPPYTLVNGFAYTNTEVLNDYIETLEAEVLSLETDVATLDSALAVATATVDAISSLTVGATGFAAIKAVVDAITGQTGDSWFLSQFNTRSKLISIIEAVTDRIEEMNT